MAKSSKDSQGQNVEKEIQITLRNVFKHTHFKSKTQEAAVHTVLKGAFFTRGVTLCIQFARYYTYVHIILILLTLKFYYGFAN